MLVPKAVVRPCRYGGFRGRQTQGHGLLPRREDRRALVVHRSGGLPVLVHGRERRGHRSAAHADRRPRQVVCEHSHRGAVSGARRGTAIRCAARCRSTSPTSRSASAATGACRRGAAHLAPHARLGLEHRVRPRAQRRAAPDAPLTTALCVSAARLAARRQAPSWACPTCIRPSSRDASNARPPSSSREHRDDPWMIGYFIGNEPPWPARESQLVDLVLAGPGEHAASSASSPELAQGDTPSDAQATRARRVRAVSRDRQCRRAAP